MAINGSDLINNPWNTTTKAFTDLFGMGFYLIPISFIALALYIKTRNIVVVSAFIIASGSLMSSISMFSSYPEMSFVYLIFTAFGVVALVLGLYFNIKG